MHTLMLATIVLAGLAGAYFAKQRGRNPWVWFSIGIFFGLLGVLTLFLLPKVEATLQAPQIIPVNPYLNREWFFIDQDEQQHGPSSFELLVQRWNEQGINRDTYVWTDGMNEWERIAQLPEFEFYLKQ